MAEGETIVARATAQGEGALAIVRLSGPAALDVFARMFRAEGGQRMKGVKDRHLTKGEIIDPQTGTTADTVLAVTMPAPHSYTGEDVVEITCHGGTAVVRRILEIAIREGARLAEPGEFTKRAFLNGKIDLAQAEAVCDLIRAQTNASSDIALRQLQGAFSNTLSAMQEQLINVAAEIEARIDFPEEDIGAEDRARLESQLMDVAERMSGLLLSGAQGKLFRDGVRIPIVGKPNTGKSCLFNALVGRERAIVTPHPGTTRDTIEMTVEIGGLAATIIDTAGMRSEPDEVERLGISRTESEIGSADLILFLVDRSVAIDEEDMGLYEKVRGKRHLVVINKIDLPARVSGEGIRAASGAPEDVLQCEVSALLKQNIDTLEREMVRALIGEREATAIATEDILVSNLRHLESLRRGQEAVERAGAGLHRGVSSEFVMVDVHEGLGEIGAILGENVDEAILERIFSTFCIGK